MAHTADCRYTALRDAGGKLSLKEWIITADRRTAARTRWELPPGADDWDWLPGPAEPLEVALQQAKLRPSRRCTGFVPLVMPFLNCMV